MVAAVVAPAGRGTALIGCSTRAVREGGAHQPGLLSPWRILAAFAVIAAIAGVARVPPPVAAGTVLLLLGVVVARHPGNGLAAFVLASPFLLGEYKTPYFLLEPLAVAGVLLSFLAHRVRDRLGFVPRYAGAALFLVAAAVIAVPLNLRDLLEDLWLVRSLDWSLMFRQGIPDISHLKYLERILVLGLGAGLFTVASQPAMAAAVVGALRPLGVLLATLAAFGLLRFFGLIRTAGDYLTLSFWTWEHPDLRLTAVAWNPDYLAQWLVLVLPLVVALGFMNGPGWQRAMAAVAGTVGVAALLFTFQRAGYLAFLVALGVLAALVRGRTSVTAARVGGLLALGALVLGAGAWLDAFVLHGRLVARVHRLVEDPNRLRLWDTALRMALDHPLLGVGTGRYAFFFHEYAAPELRRGFGPFWGTAHSTYLQLLAEQGLLGLASFAALFGGVWLGALRRMRGIGGDRGVLASGVLAALGGWLAYGLFQFSIRVSAVFYLACILTGVAVALVPPGRRRPASRRRVLVAIAIGLAVLAVRVETALRRPVSPGYEAGFHRWEREPDGHSVRWTRGRAAMTTPVRGRILELRLQAPIPGVEGRPQVVEVRVDRRPVALLRLAAPGWQEIHVPIQAPRGAHVLVELEVAYTFVPSRLAASRDGRTLGVMVGEVTWRDA